MVTIFGVVVRQYAHFDFLFLLFGHPPCFVLERSPSSYSRWMVDGVNFTGIRVTQQKMNGDKENTIILAPPTR